MVTARVSPSDISWPSTKVHVSAILLDSPYLSCSFKSYHFPQNCLYRNSEVSEKFQTQGFISQQYDIRFITKQDATKNVGQQNINILSFKYNIKCKIRCPHWL